MTLFSFIMVIQPNNLTFNKIIQHIDIRETITQSLVCDKEKFRRNSMSVISLGVCKVNESVLCNIYKYCNIKSIEYYNPKQQIERNFDCKGVMAAECSASI